VGHSLQGAGGAFGFWFAEFLAEPDEQCVVLVKKLDILLEIRLEQFL
jgi:hypothetical protein